MLSLGKVLDTKKLDQSGCPWRSTITASRIYKAIQTSKNADENHIHFMGRIEH